MPTVQPLFGVNSQAEIDVDSLKDRDAIEFAAQAASAGLYVRFFSKDDGLWAIVVGPFDELTDFLTTL